MRTFVAVDLDPKIKSCLLDIIYRLSRMEAHIKWVKKQGMHITLKFLGEVPEIKIPEIITSLRKACYSGQPFQLACRGTGFFPHESRSPRVLWAGIEQSRELAMLHERIEEEFAQLGFPREKRAFHPHLTLGRVKSGQNISAVIKELNQYRDSNFGGMQVEKVTLFKSTLKPTGAEYAVLSEIQLT